MRKITEIAVYQQHDDEWLLEVSTQQDASKQVSVRFLDWDELEDMYRALGDVLDTDEDGYMRVIL